MTRSVKLEDPDDPKQVTLYIEKNTTFTTNVLENGEITDRTNVCISMIMGTTYDSFTFDI